MAESLKNVITVTAGSGIGPLLSILHSHCLDRPMLRSTPDPLRTYGGFIIEDVLKTDSEAMIVDTKVSGRSDMLVQRCHLTLKLKQKPSSLSLILNPPGGLWHGELRNCSFWVGMRLLRRSRRFSDYIRLTATET